MRLRSALVLPALVVVHTVVWGVALHASPFSFPPRTIAAQYLSSLVLVILSTNLLLATRARPLESAFGGLDKMFASHRIDGIAAASAIVFHVLIVPLTTPLFPGRALGLTTLALIEGSVLLATAPRAPWRRLLDIPYQTWKAEHGFMGVFVALGAIHSMLVPTLLRPLPLLAEHGIEWIVEFPSQHLFFLSAHAVWEVDRGRRKARA